MKNLNNLEARIKRIEARNNLVELDKAWETSYTRKFILIIFTYLAIGLYLDAIGVPKPWLNSIVPSLGFLLSTLSLPFFKKVWSEYMWNKKC